jgi:hypothetical protein
MKKSKLKLSRETVLDLSAHGLGNALGGWHCPTEVGCLTASCNSCVAIGCGTGPGDPTDPVPPQQQF